jgi:prepilin-type N-terminal cleavage/methylation domain-containing protein
MIFHQPTETASHRRPLRNRRGFTLVELMIAVVLIAVLAALSAPTISSSMERGRVTDMNRGISNSFLQTRSHAMRSGQAMFVDIRLGENSRIAFYEPDNLGDAASCVLADDQGPATNGNNILREIRPEDFGLSLEFAAVNPDGINRLCISPSGRVLTPGGTPLTADGGCEGRNFVLTIRDPGSSSDLDNCDLSDDNLAARELAHFSMIHVAEGGQVRVSR